jgi:hypothetical protein
MSTTTLAPSSRAKIRSLERAIAEAMARIKTTPGKLPNRPADPVKLK